MSCQAKPSVQDVQGVMKALQVNILEWSQQPQHPTVATVQGSKTTKVTMDSGAAASVIHPKDMPQDAEVECEECGGYYTNASGGNIKRYGTSKTIMKSAHGQECTTDWNLAAVSRALHPVSSTCGPKDHEYGHADVLFHNKIGVVVPPGVVKMILETIEPIMAHERDNGGLYTADVQLSSSPRLGAQS